MTKVKSWDDDDYLPHNYSVHVGDIADSLFAKRFNRPLSNKQTKALLYLYGMDVSRKWNTEDLDADTSMRSPITGDVVKGGWIYTGFERTDEVWRKDGIKNLQKFMYTPDGVDELIKQMEGEVESSS